MQQSHLLNLDTASGNNAGRAHLDCIDRLIHILELERTCRRYRGSFTASYRQMLGEDSYLIDILDSAQEACPFMWVNGEKYVFSDVVI